jgi:3-oxoacyl-[acyl-carrier-protein] synthase II
MTARVFVTGLGVVSPIGLTTDGFWAGCLAGRSGARALDGPWVTETQLTTRIAAQVGGFGAEEAGVSGLQAKLLDRVTLFALGAARKAVFDAGFTLAEDKERKAFTLPGVDPYRVATVIGSGIGGLSTIEAAHAAWRERRTKEAVKRYALPMLIPNAPAGHTAIQFDARGEAKALSTACAAGTMAIGDAWRLLVSGEADVAICGGTEAFASDHDAFGLVGFERLKTMSTRNEAPERASRPFDKDRDGFVLGEGAGVLVLETSAHARARGARAYAEVLGYASNCDARSMMQLDETGERIERLIRRAVAVAGLALTDVDHVSAHGTSTPLNDRTEARAIRSTFGAHADGVSVTALKSMTGHCIAGSGALEAAALALSLFHGVQTPTINHDATDPDCPIDVVANAPRRVAPRAALKLSYGFGGHNACLVLGRA